MLLDTVFQSCFGGCYGCPGDVPCRLVAVTLIFCRSPGQRHPICRCAHRADPRVRHGETPGIGVGIRPAIFGVPALLCESYTHEYKIVHAHLIHMKHHLSMVPNVSLSHIHTHTHTYVYTYSTRYHSRRKFRSQTSDSMDRWKSTGGKSQRREEKKREDQRRERVRRKKIQVCEKIGKLQNTVFFQWFVAPEGQKVGSLTSQNVQHTHTPCTDHFWKLRCQKSARRCGAKHMSKSKAQKTKGYGAFLNVQMSFHVAGAGDCAPCQKWAKREGFVAVSKKMAGVGHMQRIWQDAFRVAVRRSGRWFPERGCILEHQILRFAEMILRDRCSTSYDLASIFRGRRSTFDRWSGKIATRIGTRPSALHIFDGCLAELFRFWCCQLRNVRKSRRIVWFLMLSRSKLRKSRRRCEVQKLRKPRRIASFSNLPIDW